jgi:hypothetical protein
MSGKSHTNREVRGGAVRDLRRYAAVAVLAGGLLWAAAVLFDLLG